MKKKRERGQVSVFIIAGLVIVGIIGVFMLFRTGIITDTIGKKEINPDAFLKSCMEEKVEDATRMISIHGGYISNPLNRTFQFDDEPESSDISYLCYTQNNYEPCVNQEPMLVQHLKDEVYDYLSDEDMEVSVRECFNELVISLEKEGYVVDANYEDFKVKISPKKIAVDISGKVILTKSGETTEREGFEVVDESRFYDLAVVSQEIVSQEARFCNFDSLGFMLLYPQFKIDKFTTGDSTKIYTVEDVKSRERFRFAVRGCVIPPGI